MSVIRSVLGDIKTTQLGLTLSHEHLLWSIPEPFKDEDPDLGFDDPEMAINELKLFQRVGGAAIVEMTTAEIGRKPEDLVNISRASDIHILAATGHHKDKFSRLPLAELSVEAIMEKITREINVGIDGTDIKAGVIKAATSKDQATPSERKVIQAVGQAFKETGAPVSTHTEAGTFALEQIKLLMDAGVPPERMLIGHLDRGLPEQLYLAIARTGVYLGFDQIGKEKYWLDSERIRIIMTLVIAGYTNRILLSGDMARKSNWISYGPECGPGLAYIPTRFQSKLIKAGIPKDLLHEVMLENPSRFFAIT
jgi:predicted metal-dependent phosphotriesterase family hydrolase